MPNTVPNTNISLKDDLHIKWTDANGHELIDSSSTSAPYKTSELRGALFTDGSTIPSSGVIKISDMKGKHFAQKFNTADKKVYSTFSAYSSKLYGTTASSSNSGSGNTSNRRAKLASGQSRSYPYAIMLFTPHGKGSSASPGLIVDRTNSDTVDEATVWFKVVNHNNYAQVQMGIIKKDNTLTWTQQKAYLHNKHATYADRMCFHGTGFHNYSGSRDDILSSSSIVSPAYKSGKYGSKINTNFHNIIGKTGGTMRSQSGTSSNSGGTDHWFFTNSLANYTSYRGNSILSNHGLKIKWYTTTLDVTFTSGSSEITPQSGTWSSSDLSNIFSGMYISDTSNVSLTNGVFIGKVHTDSITLYRETGVSSLTEITASSSGNDTITISGYLYWTLATTATYSNPVILGPPHTVLPRYHADSAGGTSASITEWAFFIGDTTSGTTNTFEYDVRNEEPSGSAFSYSVTYGLKPSTNYEFAVNVGGTYAIAGSLSSITPSSSGYAFTTQTSSNIGWSQYSMGARIQFLVAGEVVALGVQNRFGGYISLFPDSSETAAVGPVSVAGTGSTSTTRNYKYTTLSKPLSVSANSIYRIGFTNSSNGYAYHNISAYDGTATASGNIKLLSGAYRYVGNTNTPYRPTTLNTTHGYGSTDLIFLPD